VVTAVFPATPTLPSGYLSTGTSSGSGSIGLSPGWGLSGAGTLIWSKNNSTANYNDAAAACVAMNTSSALGYSSGWRLPTQPELSGFYNTNRSVYSAAGWELRYTWSSTNYSSGHYLVDLNGGGIRWDIDSWAGVGDGGYKMLCVHY
jgi:hypothetical protein